MRTSDRGHWFVALAALALLSLVSSASSQHVPHVRTGEVDACGGDVDSYWYTSLRDALTDRAPFICGCNTAVVAARITMAIEIRPRAVIASCETTESLDVTHDVSSCVAHRVHAVAHAWLAWTSPYLGAPSGTRESTRVHDFASIECPAPGGTDVRSAFSRAFLESHPRGLRADVALPPAACRQPLVASLRFPFTW